MRGVLISCPTKRGSVRRLFVEPMRHDDLRDFVLTLRVTKPIIEGDSFHRPDARNQEGCMANRKLRKSELKLRRHKREKRLKERKREAILKARREKV